MVSPIALNDRAAQPYSRADLREKPRRPLTSTLGGINITTIAFASFPFSFAKTQGLQMQDSMVTTALTLPGFEITKNFGIVRGITVRSRSIVGNFFGSLQTLFGGNITIYTNLCEQARAETYQLMCEHARDLGANAIISVRYDATELMPGLTEVLCYGTAVCVQPAA